MITKSEALARQVSNPESFTDQDIVAAHLRAQDALIGELVEASQQALTVLAAETVLSSTYDQAVSALREAVAKAEVAR